MSVEEQMVSLAFGTYKECDISKYPDTKVAGWQQVLQLSLKGSTIKKATNDLYTIYRHGNECVLACAGTNDVADWLSNADARTTTKCGFEKMHMGFALEVDDLTNHAVWQDQMVPYLKGTSCSAGVTIVGHSLGGAQAAILAACANNGTKPFGFTAKALYTVGGAAPAKAPLPNKEAADSCFAGARFYNHDKIEVDPVAALAQTLKFFHPRVPAVRLSKPSFLDSSKLEYYTHGCNTECAHKYPKIGVGKISMHQAPAYLERVKEVYTKRSATVAQGNCTELSDAPSIYTSFGVAALIVLLCFDARAWR